ncbi:integrase [Salmonella enterica]|nr:integrase [Salmonella enterica]
MCATLTCTRQRKNRDRDAPFWEERIRYLRYCANSGASPGALTIKRNELFWIAHYLPDNASQGVSIKQLHEMAKRRSLIHKGHTMTERMIVIARPWLIFLGWWRKPEPKRYAYHQLLSEYVNWMRDEKGFTKSTIDGWKGVINKFLLWCNKTGHDINQLRPEDIDEYFISNSGRWNRKSIRSITGALRIFLRYAANNGLCPLHLPETIISPRIYNFESLPSALAWEDVRKLLSITKTGKTRDIRNRIILMLLSIYGLRRGEVAMLRLEDIDWGERKLHIFRLKCKQPQTYPLLPVIAEALSDYIETVRPQSSEQTVFLGLNAPHRPLTSGAFYDIVSKNFDKLEINLKHRGPHALRHACAVKLLSQGLTLKEIGDHLGHRSTETTMIYAKVDLEKLKEVGNFDLGELL